jgi:hypothetical protein
VFGGQRVEARRDHGAHGGRHCLRARLPRLRQHPDELDRVQRVAARSLGDLRDVGGDLVPAHEPFQQHLRVLARQLVQPERRDVRTSLDPIVVVVGLGAGGAHDRDR